MTIASALDEYIVRFSKLKTDKGNQWRESSETKHQAPYKAILLLSVLDRYSEGAFTSNLVELDEDLLELFAGYWSLVMPPDRRGNIAMPFFHLQSDGFWHLKLRPGQQITVKIHAVSRLNETVYGATLDEDLHHLLLEESSRDALRNVLINRYFSEQIGQQLLAQGFVNRQAYQYSLKLVEQAKHRIKEHTPYFDSQVEVTVRNQGFRLAVRQAYDYRCAMTGLRLVTDSGHIAVVGAHIVPWSVNYNDNPTNGIALSPTCHWAFDEGLLTVTDDYKVKTSPQLSKGYNSPHHLGELEGIPILLPKDESLHPARESLRWHRVNVFCRH